MLVFEPQVNVFLRTVWISSLLGFNEYRGLLTPCQGILFKFPSHSELVNTISTFSFLILSLLVKTKGKRLSLTRDSHRPAPYAVQLPMTLACTLEIFIFFCHRDRLIRGGVGVGLV